MITKCRKAPNIYNMKTSNYFFLFLLVICSLSGMSQVVPQGINYQGLARNSSGLVLSNQAVSVKVGIYSSSVNGTPEWEETHAVTTNQIGLFYFVIGQGISTGAGSVSSFAALNWGAAAHFIKISMDETGGSSYTAIDTLQFWSVPYAMYSGTAANAANPMRLHQLSDVDTIGVNNGYVLKWNGSLWLPAPDNDSDTALFAYNAGHSATADTALYAYNVLSVVDTVPYAVNSDSSVFAVSSNNSVNAGHSDYCDTAVYALSTASTYNYWNISGNSGINPAVNFVGTINSADLVFKTNNTERMRITSAGKLGIGISAPTASLHLVGNDGLVAEGTFGSGSAPPSGAGTRMVWYPKKGAFRAGSVTGTQWDDANIGNYSFAANNNNIASGAYSTAFGFGSIASGAYSFVACQGSQAVGISSVSMGTGCNANGAYSIAMGRGSTASDSSSVAIGYHNTASGKYGVSFGYETVASGSYSMALGFWASTNGKKGSFVFADNSSSSVTNSSADNQFLVRSSGGALFYSNTALTAGVSLPAGGGSWASVSDKNKKEHFKNVDGDAVLKKLDQLSVTTWNYKTQASSIRHIGPMAQDFYKLFRYGESDTTITTIDIDGVSLAAIQALAKKTKELKEKTDEVQKLKMQVAQLEAEKSSLEKRITGIEKKLGLAPPVLTAFNLTGK